MKRRTAMAVAVLCAAAGLLPAGRALAGTIPEAIATVVPSAPSVPLGGTFSVDVVGDFSQPVLGWGLDLLFDPARLTLQGSPVIGPAWSVVSAADGDGLAGLAFPDGIDGMVLLATLTFRADALGPASLDLGVTGGDLTEGFPLDPSGFATFELVGASVEVVPEPATAALLALALTALAARRGRRGRRGDGS